MKHQTTFDSIGNSTTAATLTAAYGGNTSSKYKVERADELNLEVQYTPGADNQYVEILIETSVNGTNWKVFPTQIASTTEVQTFANPIVVPGDKISVSGTAENMGAFLDLNHIWLRVSAREKTNAGGTPSTFGTVWITNILKFDLN